MATNYKQLTSLTSGSQYEYRVTALGDGTTYTDSDPSSIANFSTLTPLDVPTGLALTKTTSSISATWTAVAHATGYVVAYATTNGSWTESEVSAASFTLSSLAQGVSYDFKVKAIAPNTAYEASAYSAVVSTTTLIKLATPAPSLATTTSSITVTWAAIPNATSYVVAWKTAGGSYTEESVTGTSFVKDNIGEGETYTFKVQAITTNAAYENSEYSAEISDSSQITLATPAPTLTKTTNSITATWTAIPNAGGYVVAYKTGSGDFTTVAITDTTYTLSGLATGVTYTLKVKATSDNDAYVDSAYSAERSATTLIPLSAPANLAVDQITSTSARLSWDAVANAIGYKVQYRVYGETEWEEITLN